LLVNNVKYCYCFENKGIYSIVEKRGGKEEEDEVEEDEMKEEDQEGHKKLECTTYRALSYNSAIYE